MKVKQIKESMASVQDRLDAMTNLIETENRSFTEDETTKFGQVYQNLNLPSKHQL